MIVVFRKATKWYLAAGGPKWYLAGTDQNAAAAGGAGGLHPIWLNRWWVALWKRMYL